MTDSRPDPDRLLAQVSAEEAHRQRGKLKIFFGASAGVGKTCAMLSAAHAAKLQGTDVVIGIVESHGRAATEALAGGLERLPPRQVAHRERTLAEFDLDGALARRPALLLLDELAHSNLAGSRHPKRWQDAHELTEAGIDVWTTMNVQHLESLNDIVGGITGVRVWETVPDAVFDQADEVVIIDLPPDDLLQRLKEGKVYLPQQAEQAVRNFFRKGNLIALRELALRRTADRVDDAMLAWRQRGSVPPVWGTRASLLAAIGPNDDGEKTVRSTARLADQLGVPWHAAYVETPRLQRLPDAARRRVLRSLALAQELGAQTATLAGQDVAAALVAHARQHNLAQVVLGRGRRHRPWQRGVADRIGALAQDLDVIQVGGAASALVRDEPRAQPGTDRFEPRPYLMSAGTCAATALVATPLLHIFDLSNIVMLFLLAVVWVALRHGRGPAVLAAFLSVAAFDFFFVSPRFSFAISDVQYLVTFAVMLIVALVIGQLTAGLSYQARVAQRREDRMRALYEMSRDLSSALMTEQVAGIGARFLAAQFSARSALLVADDADRLQTLAGDIPGEAEPLAVDAAIAQWSFDRGQPAGAGTDTLPAGTTLYLPLSAPMRVRGVLALQPRDAARLAVPEQRRLLDTCASLLAISLERIHYIEVARGTTVQMESERLRNSLLAAISHDLRTPLASLVGLAETLTLAKPPLQGAHAVVAQSIKDAALRMNALVGNLLDMARLESGSVRLNLQWQPIEEVTGSALAAIRPALRARKVDVRLPEDLPLLRFDAVLVERVLVNLLENAAKYTPEGTPIAIGAAASSDTVSLWIDDQGPGLPAGREEAIFDKFERGRRESATPGVGLGLAICRAIMQAHGGAIVGRTRPEGGARFTLTLPRGEPPTIDPDRLGEPAGSETP